MGTDSTMTPGQRRAADHAIRLYEELPARPSPDLAASWWAAIRAALQDIRDEFTEEGEQ